MPKVRNLRHRVFPPSHGDDKAVARQSRCGSRVRLLVRFQHGIVR
nr:MAG TPA: hypothetical protein [Caudoviricetes sp.]